MKTVKTNIGWEEITTKVFNITTIQDNPYMTVGKWVESNKKIGLYRKRKRCSCCKKAWESIDLNENLYSVFTDKGYKIICHNCYSEFRKTITP